MKTLKLFLEDFKEDEEELQTGAKISNIDLAHSLALTTCSFEFECYLKTPKTNVSESYRVISNQIKKVFKTKKIKQSTDYHGIPTEFKILNPDYWFVEHDGSLDNDYPGYTSVEIISPWILAKDAEAFIKRFKKEVFEHFDGITDETTGFHVNLKTKNAVANPLKLLLLTDQEKELDIFSRSKNTFTKPHNLKKYALQYEEHYDLNNPEIMKHIVNTLIGVLDRNKLKAINFKDYNFKDGSGRIEFRIIGDAYLNELYENTIESVNRFIMLMASATDDKAHIKEFSTKFSKLLKEPSDVTMSAREAYQFAVNKRGRVTEKLEKFILRDINVIWNYIVLLHKIDKDIEWTKGKEILAHDTHLAIEYTKLTKKPFKEAEPLLVKDANSAFSYALALKAPFKEGEDIIATDPMASYAYAKHVLNGRFKKGEPAIATKSFTSYEYARHVLNGRFKEGEKAIIKDPFSLMEYVEDIIKGRWPEAEDELAKNDDLAVRYAVEILKGPFPKGEKVIAESPDYALKYAKYALKGPFPMGEKAIAKYTHTQVSYEQFLKGLK